MRRTLGTLLGLGLIVAMGGVAYAATGHAATTAGKSTLSTEQIAQLRAEAANGPQQVGTLVRVDKSLTGATHRLVLRYPGASYVKVHFSRLLMLPGDHLTIANPAGTESYTYSDDGALGLTDLLTPTGGRWGMSIDGDTAVLSIHHAESADTLGLGTTLAQVGVFVDEVARGFTPAERAAAEQRDAADRNAAIKAVAAAGGDRTESVCGEDDSIDAVCYKTSDPVAYKASKAVARILINGTELCTAWRVGPTDRLFTDHHCFTSTTDARNTEVWFNYECAACGGYDTLATTKVWGERVYATDADLDYTLFSVYDFAQIQQFGYLTIDTSAPKKGDEIYIPQHPEGNPTEIAMSSDQDGGGDCQVVDPAADGYVANSDVSYYCDTQGGSSGSPVIDRTTNRVIALHHFGGCPNSGVRMLLIYNQVRTYLTS